MQKYCSINNAGVVWPETLPPQILLYRFRGPHGLHHDTKQHSASQLSHVTPSLHNVSVTNLFVDDYATKLLACTTITTTTCNSTFNTTHMPWIFTFGFGVEGGRAMRQGRGKQLPVIFAGCCSGLGGCFKLLTFGCVMEGGRPIIGHFVGSHIQDDCIIMLACLQGLPYCTTLANAMRMWGGMKSPVRHKLEGHSH